MFLETTPDTSGYMIAGFVVTFVDHGHLCRSVCTSATAILNATSKPSNPCRAEKSQKPNQRKRNDSSKKVRL